MNSLPTLNLKELERIAIREAMQQTGSVTKAAHLLGIGRSTLYRRLQRPPKDGDKTPEVVAAQGEADK
jgi:transcriptional regulator of acetoin/glycerol metabolism